MTEYLASPFRERTRTHRSHPSEVNSCSAASCSRSRSRARRCSRSDSLSLDVDLAMTAPFLKGPPAAGRCRPNAPRRGAKIRRPARSGSGPRRSSHARRQRAAARDTATTTRATGPTKTDAPGPASDASPGPCSDQASRGPAAGMHQERPATRGRPDGWITPEAVTLTPPATATRPRSRVAGIW